MKPPSPQHPSCNSRRCNNEGTLKLLEHADCGLVDKYGSQDEFYFGHACDGEQDEYADYYVGDSEHLADGVREQARRAFPQHYEDVDEAHDPRYVVYVENYYDGRQEVYDADELQQKHAIKFAC